jgi:hypothetical protein
MRIKEMWGNFVEALHELGDEVALNELKRNRRDLLLGPLGVSNQLDNLGPVFSSTSSLNSIEDAELTEEQRADAVLQIERRLVELGVAPEDFDYHGLSDVLFEDVEKTNMPSDTNEIK